jgi:hypothetical protein
MGVLRAQRCHLRAGFQQCRSSVEMDTCASRPPPRTPRSRVCQSQNHSHQSPQVGSYFMLSRFTTSSSRAARPQPLAPKCLAPKCQCQSPRQNANVNLLAKMPMSTSSPNYQGQSLRQNAPPTSPSLLLRLVVPVQASFKIVPLKYFVCCDS